jgi:hypothetical protein
MNPLETSTLWPVGRRPALSQIVSCSCIECRRAASARRGERDSHQGFTEKSQRIPKIITTPTVLIALAKLAVSNSTAVIILSAALSFSMAPGPPSENHGFQQTPDPVVMEVTAAFEKAPPPAADHGSQLQEMPPQKADPPPVRIPVPEVPPIRTPPPAPTGEWRLVNS